MKQYLIIFISATFLFGCTKKITEKNDNPKTAYEASAISLFSSAQKSLVDIITTCNVNRNVYRQYAQYWTNTTYPQESRYDLITRAIPANFWLPIYTGALQDSKLAKEAVAKDALIDESTKKAQTAIIDIWQCYAYHFLTMTFGNVPYTSANDISNKLAKYDDAMTIHKDLITRLKADVATLGTNSDAAWHNELILGGDTDAWTMFANSLLMRLAIYVADADNAYAKSLFEAASTHAITSNADNVMFHYLDLQPNNNPLSENLYGAGITTRKDFVAANTIVNKMKKLGDSASGADPRIPFYFSKNNTGIYKGGTYGSSNGWSSNSKPAYVLGNKDAPSLLFDYAEICFMNAEAAERGWAVSGTAETWYNKGVEASFEYWGAGSANAYLAHPTVNYTAQKTAGVTWKEIIGTQQWVAFYNRGFEGWTSWRRLDFPILNVPSSMTYADIPVRWTYPVNEQTLNGSNYSAASAAIGGDLMKTKLYFDKF